MSMSDTIQTVRWSINSNEPQQMWLSRGREQPNEIFWESIWRKDLESQMRSAFTITDPLWYGFWIDSPLSREQCSLLLTLFSDVVMTTPRYERELKDFISALTEVTAGHGELNVELSPPGHVDLGWITTFVHCPRCKAEGPVERWQSSYPDDPVECQICKFTYCPTDTFHAEEEYFAETVNCKDCAHSFPIRNLTRAEIIILQNEHYYHEAVEELSWLRRVSAFYERHPDQEGKIQPHFLNLLESDDPGIKADLLAGIPFDQIELKNDSNNSDPECFSVEDGEVADYLRHHHFSLNARLRFVQEAIEQREPKVRNCHVPCPECGGIVRAHR